MTTKDSNKLTESEKRQYEFYKKLIVIVLYLIPSVCSYMITGDIKQALILFITLIATTIMYLW